ADQEVLYDLLFLGIDNGDRMAGFTGHIDPVAVWTDRDAFRLDASGKRAYLLTRFQIVTCRFGCIFVGGPKLRTIRTHRKAFWIRAGIVGFDDLVGFHVNGSDFVFVGLHTTIKIADCHIYRTPIGADIDTAWPDIAAFLGYMNGINDFAGLGVNNRN